VLLLVYWIGAAGMEQQLLHLARGLAERGHDVTIGCFHPWVDVSRVTELGVRVVKLGPRSRLGRIPGIVRAYRLARRAEVVHCTGWDASLWGRIAAALARRPVLVTDHSADRSIAVSDRSGRSRGRLIGWHNRLLDRFTYATVAVAHAQAPVLAAEGVRPQRMVHVPNGVPLAALREAAEPPADRAALGLPDGARVVVHVARFDTPKRQHLTYEAVARVRAELAQDVRAVFVGGRPPGIDLKDRLERRAREESAGWAHFLGVREDVPALLALADVAVLPSATEALPMVVLEAMALGVPQVASAVGDVGPLLRRTGAGLTFPVDDAQGLALALRRVLTEPALAERLRDRAREAIGEFDADRMIDSYAELFEAAVAGRPPHSAAPAA
jgi:glycosyltransferase involved in cell wall biosynthesis